jgi:glycosyltransferase involved in cell wall biosynthesis
MMPAPSFGNLDPIRVKVADSPRVLIVGNFLSSAGRPRGVCEDLAERLLSAGWQTVTTSTRSGRVRRLLDMISTVWRERANYDVAQVDVYSGKSFIWAELVCTLLLLLAKPYVLTLHGGNLPRFSRRWPRRVRRLLRSAVFVSCPSPFLAEQLKRFRDDIIVIPNGLVIAQYDFWPRINARPVLVWLRAFHRIYNPSLALRAVARLAREFPAIRLTMIGPDKGDGSFQKARETAETERVVERVSFPGVIPKSQVGDWLKGHDIFLNTTNVDNAPVSVLEAMACGLCVVSTDAGGVPDLVRDGEDALLVPPDDPDAMAAAVRRILTEPHLAEKLSRNARARAKRHDWSAVLPCWVELLTSAADRSYPRRAVSNE